jgi:hypothetical protein
MRDGQSRQSWGHVPITQACRIELVAYLPMITFAFWNVNGPKLRPGDARFVRLQRLLTLLALRRRVDVLILAESPFAGRLRIVGFSEAPTLLSPNPITKCRLEIYHRDTVSIDPVHGGDRWSLQAVTVAASGASFLLAATHLPAPPRPSDETRRSHLHRMVARLATWEQGVYEQQGHRRMIVVGDLNFEPYDLAVVGPAGLNAVSSKQLAFERSRQPTSAEAPLYLYNPMWGHYGDTNGGPPGTYFWDASEDDECRFWYMRDQVLLRPEMLPFWNDQSLEILGSVGNRPLLGKTGRPNAKYASDHLPIVFNLNL